LKTIDDQILLRALCRRLNDRELVIIHMKYFEGYNQAEIARHLHLSQSRISQIKTAAIRRLQKAVI